MRSHWDLINDSVVIFIMGIQESVILKVDVCPHALSLGADLEGFPLFGGVAQECAKMRRVDFCCYELQQ